MIENVSERLIDGQDRRLQPAYASSYRAAAACGREVTRLLEAVEAGVAAWYAGGDVDKPIVRRSPSRCIVQCGPVALTITWLQSGRGTVAEGELLVMLWRGAVARRSPRDFERVAERPGESSATALWEEVLVVDAQSEAAWRWASPGTETVTSAALADRCVDRLRAAYAECAVAS